MELKKNSLVAVFEVIPLRKESKSSKVEDFQDELMQTLIQRLSFDPENQCLWLEAIIKLIEFMEIRSVLYLTELMTVLADLHSEQADLRDLLHVMETNCAPRIEAYRDIINTFSNK